MEEAKDEEEKNEEEKNEDDVTFESLGLADELCVACKRMGYKAPTSIQRETIPVALTGKDIIGLAQTGSGKTAAFALPILNDLITTRPTPKGTFAVVIAPTRELVFQIHEQFEALGSEIGLRSVAIAGGIDMVSQAVALAKRPHVIVASPGRLVDHLEHTKGFSLRSARYLVLDEAVSKASVCCVRRRIPHQKLCINSAFATPGPPPQHGFREGNQQSNLSPTP
mmetsp:Transcript_18104/g.72451  ORF Transcript_18104/g.72451 Transcript_18104/m.72451 type:complete len:224 (-) Transcript_18104:2137-2808(-)